MAPISPAVTTASVMEAGSTTPLPSVLATCVWKIRKAMKLKKAAQRTAQRGASTRVQTIVAIELAASWNPFTKSNASARATIAYSTTSSGILHHDGADRVRHRLAG